jgi:hypothetical protein
MDPKKFLLKYIIDKLQKSTTKRHLKAARGKQIIMYKENFIKVSGGF